VRKLLERWLTLTLRYTPDSWIVTIFLTGIVLLFALLLTSSSLLEILFAWGKGFSALHTFAMQMTLILLTGEIVARSPLVQYSLIRIARFLAKKKLTPFYLAFLSMGIAWVHWGLSLIVSGIVVRTLFKEEKKFNPLYLACSYLGLGTTWHCGLSGSVPLLLATPGNFLEKEVGIVPLSETLFSLYTLLPLFLSLLTTLSFSLLLPSHSFPLQREIPEDKPSSPPSREGSLLLSSSLFPKIVSLFGLTYIFLLFHREGIYALHLDTVNILFLFLAIGLHPNFSSFLSSAKEGIHSTFGVILQFPLYGAMWGVMKETGLTSRIGDIFLHLSTPTTFPFFVFLYTSIMNYFIPSGGSKWVVEAPYLLKTLSAHSLPLDHLVSPYIFGDMVTNLIQPFWAIPILKMVEGEFRHLIGYTFLFFLPLFFLLSILFYLLPHLFY